VDILEYCEAEAAEHLDVLQRVRGMDLAPFRLLVEASRRALQSGGKLLFFGNGGSAADAQHLATELTVRYQVNRRALSAIALTTDTSTLTAIGNDFGFDELFARQVEALCRAGDVAIGISTSGNSENVILGLVAAKARGAVTAAFSGGDGGRLASHADHLIVIPSRTTARIQEMHILLGHTLCGLLEYAPGAAAKEGGRA
jgi:D-sedoheptulose 7-phosphate isomerase